MLHGKVIRIERPGLTAGSHASEKQDFEVDGTVINSGDIDSLRMAAGLLVSNLRGY
jgi:hypothetical protein